MKTLLKSSYLAAIYLFLYLPIIVLMGLSFNDSRHSLLWHGFTLHWYRALFHDHDLWIAAGHSLLLGLLAAIIATCIGALAAVSLYRYRFLGKNILNGLVFLLIVVPDIVLGIALLLLYNQLHLTLGFFSLLFAHITFCIPFVVVILTGRLSTIDRNMFLAAKDLGATEFTIIRRVVLPLLMPGIFVALLLSFALSFDDVVVSYFVSGPEYEILPLRVYAMARLGVKPEINALCSVIFLVTLFAAVGSQLLGRKKA